MDIRLYIASILRVEPKSYSNLKASECWALKDILEKNGWKNPITREFSTPEEILVRVSEFSNDSKGFADRMRRQSKRKSLIINVVYLSE